MMPPVVKKIKLSSNGCLISAANEKKQQQPFGSFVTSFGIRKSVRVATKNNRRLMQEIKICYDVWMDILPLFDRVQLGLKLALLSHRHNSLVDKHFMGAKMFTLKDITIQRSSDGTVPIVRVYKILSWELEPKDYPLPLRLMHKIRIEKMFIRYIDHSVITFLRSIICDNNVVLSLSLRLLDKNELIFDAIVQQICFATNIHKLMLNDGHLITGLRRRISLTFLNDLPNLKLIHPCPILPDPKGLIPEQMLFKWLHIPTSNGQPKELHCVYNETNKRNVDKWANKFKETFLDATSCASYNIIVIKYNVIPHEFECVNERTQEKLTFEYSFRHWLMKRCPIAEPIVKQEEKVGNSQLNQVFVSLTDESCIGPLTPPMDEKAKKASK